jgi:quercetin dioxygenase-like cupin family protein
MEAPLGFEVRAVGVEPGARRIYDEAEWSDALVLVRRGEIELECLGGTRQLLRRGDLVWLAGLPLRALHNHGREPAVLVAISRRLTTSGPPRASPGHP